MAIVIDFEKSKGRYVISCPPWEVGLVRAIPSRRWDPKTKLWYSPALRVNSEYIKANLVGVAAISKEAKEVMESSLAKRRLATERFPPNYIYKVRPFPHQQNALDHIYGSNVFALLMEMRTGKSKVFIDYVCAKHAEGKIDSVVVVCPYSVRKNWGVEIAEHATVESTMALLDTSKKKDFDKWLVAPAGLRWLVVGVESLSGGSARGMVEKFLLTSTRAMMGVDESHRIKTHSSACTKACISLGLMAEYRAIMTGTPSANGLIDLYSQFEFLDGDIIGVGDYYSFRNRYAIMGGYADKQIIGYQNVPELMELISPVVFQVERKDVFKHLPPVQRVTRTIQMSTQQKALYRSMARDKKVTGGDGKTLIAATVLEKALRLHEISGGVMTYEGELIQIAPDKPPKKTYKKERIAGGNPKIDEIMGVVEEYRTSTIIWCAYREEIAMVSEALAAKFGADQVVEVHGGIDENERHENVYHKFQAKKARFLVANATVGGSGLKMSAAGLVIYYSSSFKYTDRKQSEDRTQSADQVQSVVYVDVICEGTVDEVVVEALGNKQDMADYIRSSIYGVAARLAVAPA